MMMMMMMLVIMIEVMMVMWVKTVFDNGVLRVMVMMVVSWG